MAQTFKHVYGNRARAPSIGPINRLVRQNVLRKIAQDVFDRSMSYARRVITGAQVVTVRPGRASWPCALAVNPAYRPSRSQIVLVDAAALSV